MKQELVIKAKALINRILYITIATCNKKGEPWNSPVYSAFDENYNFYWSSWIENQHSKNIEENSGVFVVIYDSTVPEGTGFGIYMKGKAFVLEGKDIEEIKKARELLERRANKQPNNPDKFLGNSPRRVFKFVPEKVWVNSEGDIDGNYIDVRIEITKELLNST